MKKNNGYERKTSKEAGPRWGRTLLLLENMIKQLSIHVNKSNLILLSPNNKVHPMKYYPQDNMNQVFALNDR
jgi:hypothetical protein